MKTIEVIGTPSLNKLSYRATRCRIVRPNTLLDCYWWSISCSNQLGCDFNDKVWLFHCRHSLRSDTEIQFENVSEHVCRQCFDSVEISVTVVSLEALSYSSTRQALRQTDLFAMQRTHHCSVYCQSFLTRR